MRILLIHQYFLEEDDPGGSRFNEMTQVWVNQGHEVTVLCGMLNYLTGNIPLKYNGLQKHESIYYNGVKVIRAKVYPGYNTSFINRLWNFFSFVYYGLKAVKNHRGKYDVIIATSPPLFVGYIAKRLATKFKIPYVFEVRDLWPESAISTGVLTNPLIIKISYWLEKISYESAALINVLTPAFKKVLMERKGIEQAKIIYIPNAVDFSFSEGAKGIKVDQLNKIRVKYNFVAVYIGAHGVANHLDQLLDTAKLVKNENVAIVLIGDGMNKEALIRRAKAQQLENLFFIDSVPKREVYSYISQSDVGISCLKKNDTFKTVYSNKTFDYMACQTPIVMAIDGVSRELIEKADCGLYAEPENARDIADQLLRYKSDKELMLTHGQNGYNFAKTHFDRRILAEEYVSEISKKVGIV